MCILLLFVLLVFLASCKRKPEFYINRKPYYTQSHCVVTHNETKWEYHYGFWFGKFKWHYGPHDVTICDKSKLDTLEIK